MTEIMTKNTSIKYFSSKNKYRKGTEVMLKHQHLKFTEKRSEKRPTKGISGRNTAGGKLGRKARIQHALSRTLQTASPTMTINNTFQRKCIKKKRTTFTCHLTTTLRRHPRSRATSTRVCSYRKKNKNNLLGFLINSALHLSHSASVTYFCVSSFI
ncbi:unnamed protein product [Ixodes pacificus]